MKFYKCKRNEALVAQWRELSVKMMMCGTIVQNDADISEQQLNEHAMFMAQASKELDALLRDTNCWVCHDCLEAQRPLPLAIAGMQ